MDRPKIIFVVAAVLEIIMLILSKAYAVWLGPAFIIINIVLFLGLDYAGDRRTEAHYEPENDFDIGMPQLDATVRIAHETLPYMRRGLNDATAAKICELVQKIAEVSAVAITDKERVLAYLGVGCDKHQPGDKILTEATREVITNGVYKVVRTQEQLNCSKFDNCDCPLAAAVIVPLKCREETVGTVKLYQTKDGQLAPHIIRLAIGVAQLLSMQMELAELDRQSQLVTKAELDALQAQINPHFFFNT